MRIPPSGAPLVSIPTGGTAAGAARQYDIRLGAPMQSGTNAVDAFDSTSSWRPLAQGLMDVAQAGASIGTQLLREEAETKAMEAYGQYNAEVEDRLYGENGVFSRQGADAMGLVADTAAFLDETEARLTKGLNDYGKQVFFRQARPLRAGLQGTVAGYEGRERRAARFDANKAAAGQDVKLALRFPDNERIWADVMGRAEENALALIEINAMDPENAAAYLTKTGSDLRSGRINALIKTGDLDLAHTLLSDPNLSEEHRAQATADLRDARVRELENRLQTDPQGGLAHLRLLSDNLNGRADRDMSAAIAASPDSLIDATNIDRLTRVGELAAAKQRKDTAYEQLRFLTPEEAQALLASPQGLGIPDLTPADSLEVMGRLTADQARRAEQQQAEERAQEKDLLHSTRTAYLEDPAKAYAIVADSDLPDERKEPLLAGISSGTTGKADNPAVANKMFSDIATGGLDNENDLQYAVLRGELTAKTAEQALQLRQEMRTPRGRLLGPAIRYIDRALSGLDPQYAAKVGLDAKLILLELSKDVKDPNALLNMLAPGRGDNLAQKALNLAMGGHGPLYADAGGGIVSDAGGLKTMDAPHSMPMGGMLVSNSGVGEGVTVAEWNAQPGGLPGRTEPRNIYDLVNKERQQLLEPAVKAGIFGPAPEVQKASPEELLDEPWTGSIYSTEAEDKACEAYIQRLRKLGPEEIQRNLAGLSLRERAVMMANLSILQENDGQYIHEKDLPIMLTLQGVPQQAQDRAAAYNQIPMPNQQEFEKVYTQFMDEASVVDLPEEMRVEAGALLTHGAEFTKAHGETWKKAYAQWLQAGADEDKKKDVLERLLGVCAPVFASNRARLVFKKINSAQVMYHDLEGPRDEIIVNTGHPLFAAVTPEDFVMLASTLPHELRHLQQQEFLLLNRGRGQNGDGPNAQERWLAIPSIQAVGQFGIIKPDKKFSSIIQPLELEGHLLQKTIRAGMLQHLGKPSSPR